MSPDESANKRNEPRLAQSPSITYRAKYSTAQYSSSKLLSSLWPILSRADHFDQRGARTASLLSSRASPSHNLILINLSIYQKSIPCSNSVLPIRRPSHPMEAVGHIDRDPIQWQSMLPSNV